MKSFIGNDIVFLPNFKDSLNSLFVKKVFTENEVSYCESFAESLSHFASTWAAKESIYKIIKQVYPSQKLAWRNIRISRDNVGGVPKVDLSFYPEINLEISLSLTHDGEYVWAVCSCLA
jgi:holo-[acyl-carrier protein] synthase